MTERLVLQCTGSLSASIIQKSHHASASPQTCSIPMYIGRPSGPPSGCCMQDRSAQLTTPSPSIIEGSWKWQAEARQCAACTLESDTLCWDDPGWKACM